MGDALGDLVDLVVRSALWSLVRSFVYDHPALALPVAVAAAALFLWRRSARSRRYRRS